jgi:hypothetical protein
VRRGRGKGEGRETGRQGEAGKRRSREAGSPARDDSMVAGRQGSGEYYSGISGFSSYIIKKIVADEMGGIKVESFGEKRNGIVIE